MYLALLTLLDTSWGFFFQIVLFLSFCSQREIVKTTVVWRLLFCCCWHFPVKKIHGTRKILKQARNCSATRCQARSVTVNRKPRNASILIQLFVNDICLESYLKKKRRKNVPPFHRSLLDAPQFIIGVPLCGRSILWIYAAQSPR